MDWTSYTPIKRCLIYLAASLITLSGSTGAAEIGWETITSFRDVRRLRLIDDTVWAATAGGLLAITDAAGPGRKFTNVDGLGTVDITDIIKDGSGQKWVTGRGRLIKFAVDQSEQFLFETDEDPIMLQCLSDDGDNLWVGTNIGLVLFSKTRDGGEIQDSYQLFGHLNAASTVNDIQLIGDTIWIATSSGLAAADKTLPLLLKSPAAWTAFDVDNHPELGTVDFRRVVWYDGALYVATAQGMFRLDRSPTDTFFTALPIGAGESFTELKIENDSLFFYYSGGLGFLLDSAQTSLSVTGLPSAPVTGVNTGDYRWLGTGGNGIYTDPDSTGYFSEYIWTGPPGNDISGIAVDPAGLITVGFTLQGAARYYDHRWTTLPYSFRDETTNIISDSSGNAWIGTWGSGLWRIAADSVARYDQSNSTLRGVGPEPAPYRYVVIRGLATDGRYIYAGCYHALNGYPIGIGDLNNLDSPDGWDSLGLNDGLTSDRVGSLDVFGRKLAVGSISAGLFLCQMGDDPFDHSRRSCQQYTTESGLPSDAVRCVRFSPTGDLWVGTSFGLVRWDLDRFVNVDLPSGIGPDITALEFDPRGIVWIGAANGLGRVEQESGADTVFKSRTSGLVADEITNLTLDPHTGDLYVATPSGLSVLRSGVTSLTSRIDQVVAYPNPFVIRSDHNTISFNFSGSGRVSWFTLAGELVAEHPTSRAWTGLNQRGEPVASGVYFFVITDQDGNLGRGKILLVR